MLKKQKHVVIAIATLILLIVILALNFIYQERLVRYEKRVPTRLAPNMIGD